MRVRAFGALLGALLLAGGPGLAGADGRGRGHGGGYHGGYKNWHGGHGHYRGYGHFKGYGGPRFSFWFGPGYWSAPFWYGAYGYAVYPYPYAYPYPYGRGATVIVGESPVYVERPPVATPTPPAPPAEAWWHWCESRGAYYPQVESCPEGWVKVPPRAP